MKLTVLEKIPTYKLVSITASALTPLVNNRRLPRPFLLTLVVTRRCNSRCKMCSIWKDKTSSSLSLEQIQRIFNRNDFSFVRQLTLTGGEPTLRSDLPEIFAAVLTACPNLEHVELAVNGLNPRHTLKQIEHILEIVERAHQLINHFVVQASLDGIGEIHDETRGIPGAYQRVHETLLELKRLEANHPVLKTRLSSVVMPQNVDQVKPLLAFAQELDVQVFFSPAVISGTYYSNLESTNALTFVSGEDQNLDAAHAFEALAAHEKSSLCFYYEDVSKMLMGNKRERPCMMGYYGCTIEHDGSVYPCVNYEVNAFGNLLEQDFDDMWFGPQATVVREKLHREACPTCAASCYTSPVNTGELVRLAMRRVARTALPSQPHSEE